MQWEDVLHHMSSGKCRLKHQRDTVTCLLECPHSKTLTILYAGQNVQQQKLSFTAMETQIGIATLEDSLVLIKINILYHTIQQSKPLVFTQRI